MQYNRETVVPPRAWSPAMLRVECEWTPGRWIIVDGLPLSDGRCYVPGCGAIFADGTWRLFI